jgi:hypothetical protein
MSQRPRALTLALLAATIACDAPSETQPPTQSQPLQTQPWRPQAPLPSLSATSSQPPPAASFGSRAHRDGHQASPGHRATHRRRRRGAGRAARQVHLAAAHRDRYRRAAGEGPHALQEAARAQAQPPRRRRAAVHPGDRPGAAAPRPCSCSACSTATTRSPSASPSSTPSRRPAATGKKGLAALVAIDASPRVRKKLVEMLRYVAPPHDIAGLRHGFADEDVRGPRRRRADRRVRPRRHRPVPGGRVDDLRRGLGHPRRRPPVARQVRPQGGLAAAAADAGRSTPGGAVAGVDRARAPRRRGDAPAARAGQAGERPAKPAPRLARAPPAKGPRQRNAKRANRARSPSGPRANPARETPLAPNQITPGRTAAA